MYSLGILVLIANQTFPVYFEKIALVVYHLTTGKTFKYLSLFICRMITSSSFYTFIIILVIRS